MGLFWDHFRALNFVTYFDTKLSMFGFATEEEAIGPQKGLKDPPSPHQELEVWVHNTQIF